METGVLVGIITIAACNVFWAIKFPNKFSFTNWFAAGFCIGCIVSYIIF